MKITERRVWIFMTRRHQQDFLHRSGCRLNGKDLQFSPRFTGRVRPSEGSLNCKILSTNRCDVTIKSTNAFYLLDLWLHCLNVYLSRVRWRNLTTTELPFLSKYFAPMEHIFQQRMRWNVCMVVRCDKYCLNIWRYFLFSMMNTKSLYRLWYEYCIVGACAIFPTSNQASCKFVIIIHTSDIFAHPSC